MDGRINSLQTMGTLDGPGVRFVLFMQGCNLRCGYCHNPETWQLDGGYSISVNEALENILRCRPYFGKNGGVTVSGGEPLLQADFVKQLFLECKANGIHTALDTSGSILNDQVGRLLDTTDLCLLDYKMPNNHDYLKYTGCSLFSVLNFLQELEKRKIDTWLRCVIVEDINDSNATVLNLVETAKRNPCIKKIELLPFHKMCASKYQDLKIDFRFKDIKETTQQKIEELSTHIPLHLR